MITQVKKQIESYEDFVRALHWRPVTLPDGRFIDGFKINSDLIVDEYFLINENRLYLHQEHGTDSIGGRVTNISNTYFNPKTKEWMIYDITNESQTKWHPSFSEAITEAFQTSNSD
jgi:hypothetical protein